MANERVFLTFDAISALSWWWISKGTLLISRPCLSAVYPFQSKIDIDLLQSIPRLPHVPRSQMMDHLGFRRGNSPSNKYECALSEWVKRAKHKLTIQRLQPIYWATFRASDYLRKPNQIIFLWWFIVSRFTLALGGFQMNRLQMHNSFTSDVKLIPTSKLQPEHLKHHFVAADLILWFDFTTIRQMMDKMLQ